LYNNELLILTNIKNIHKKIDGKLYFIYFYFIKFLFLVTIHKAIRVCRGRDRIIVGITTTYAISAYHHRSRRCEFESR